MLDVTGVVQWETLRLGKLDSPQMEEIQIHFS